MLKPPLETRSRMSKLVLLGFLTLASCPRFSGLHAQTSQLIVGSVNGLRNVAAYPGNNLGEKLAACLADLPAYPSGGICDARGLEGAQTISRNPFTSVVGRATVLFGNATITTVPLVLSDTQGFVIRGMGIDATKFVASTRNAPIFQGPQGNDTICDACYLGWFAVQANSDGSTGPAIDTTGFRGSTFEEIRYLSNGSGNFSSFFHFAASPQPDYFNRVIHPLVVGNSGPTTVFLFDNGGTSNARLNANCHYIYDAWIYLNTGIKTIFDARRSAQVVIRGGDIESNPGATVLIPGEHTVMEDVWMELNASEPIVPASGADGRSNDVVLRDNYIPSPFTLTIPDWAANWIIEGNVPHANVTVVDHGTNNYLQYGRAVGLGISLRTTDTQPACSSSTDGILWLMQGGAGVKDSVEVCAKDASGVYAWRTLY